MDSNKKVIVIGGDAAGMSGASQVKRLKPNWDVIVFEQSDYISYAACGMPYYIEGLVHDKEELIELTPEDAINKRKIDLRLRHKVIKIYPQEKKVLVRNEQGEHEESFDNLLIATGSLPMTAGINYPKESDKIFTLKNLYDMDEIDRFIKENSPKKCAVIGGGYIGIEMIEAFKMRGLETHLIHRRKDLARVFEIETSDLIKEEMTNNGVILNLETAIKEIKDDGGKVVIVTDKGDFVYDFVFLGLGVVPANELAKDSGIELGVKGSIKVNEYLQTNYPYIYAAGDCVETTNILTKKPVYVPLALKANKEGMMAGMNIAGIKTAFPGILGTGITKCFNLGIANTGLTYELAKNHEYDAVKITLTSRDKARYYPNSQELYSLVIAEKETGLVLGAQLVGSRDAVKRIDVYATAIHNKMTLRDIFDLDLAYAPPFAPVYDPVLLAARVGRRFI